VGLVAPDDTEGVAAEPSPAVPSPAVPSPVVPSEAIPPELVEPVGLDREDRLPVPVSGFPVVELLVVLDVPMVVDVLGIVEVPGVVALPAVDEGAVVAEGATVDGAEPQASEPDVPDIVADALGDALDVPGIVEIDGTSIPPPSKVASVLPFDEPPGQGAGLTMP
jgi:hypothetical protein